MSVNRWSSLLIGCIMTRVCFAQGPSYPPTIVNCPNDIQKTATVGETAVFVEWTEPTASVDNTAAILTFRSHAPGMLPIGESFVTYVFSAPTDPDKTSTCEFIVEISKVDDFSPIVSGCPDDFSVYYPLGAELATATWPEPTASDDSGAAFLHGKTNNPGDSFYLWANRQEVTYTFVDAANNIAKCTFYITFEGVDNEPPMVHDCPQEIHVEIGRAQNGSHVTWDGPFVEDNSGHFDVKLVGPYQMGSFFPVGLTSVLVTYTDPDGLTAECSTDVIVTQVDRIPPTVKCPDDLIVGVSPGEERTAVKWDEPEAQDNAGGMVTIWERSHSSGEFFYLNQPDDVEYSFRDSSGNEAWCRFTVTVVEDVDQPRIIGCPGYMERTVSSDVNGVNVDWEEPIAIDNTDYVDLIYKSHDPETPFYRGETKVVYLFVDSAGNEAECQFSIQINTDPSLPTSSVNNSTTGLQPEDRISFLLILILVVLTMFMFLVNLVMLVFLCKMKAPTRLRTLEQKRADSHNYVDGNNEKNGSHVKPKPKQDLPPLPDEMSYMELGEKTSPEGPYYLTPK